MQPLALAALVLVLTGTVLVFVTPHTLGVGLWSAGLVLNSIALLRRQTRAADQWSRSQRPRQ